MLKGVRENYAPFDKPSWGYIVNRTNDQAHLPDGSGAALAVYAVAPAGERSVLRWMIVWAWGESRLSSSGRFWSYATG